MADAAPAPPPASTAEKDAARRLKDQVDKLLARPAAEGTASVTLGGRVLDYRVHAAFMPVMPAGLAGGAAEPEAAVMTTAYLLQGAGAAQRPLCFACNGGPGSASIWLQFGALGPKRVVVPDDGRMPLPPYTLEGNPHSWFEHFDLVFIDPPHTGWSVSAGEDAREKLLSVDPGIEAIAGPCTMAALAYHRGTLGLDFEHRYEVLNGDAHKAWKWQRGGNHEMGFCSTSPDLARALRRNPHLKVLAAGGRYDPGTPYSASDWSLAPLNAPADVLARVTHRYYDAGHMMYTRQTDLQQLKSDLGAWLA